MYKKEKVGRDYVIYPVMNMYRIKWDGGGEMSPALSGGFTSVKEAEYAIKVYEAGREKKVRRAKRGIKNEASENERDGSGK